MVEFLSCHSQSDICNQHNQSYLRLGKSRQVRVTLCRCVKHVVVRFFVLLVVITLNSGQNFFEVIFADEPFFCPRKSYRRNRLVFDQALDGLTVDSELFRNLFNREHFCHVQSPVLDVCIFSVVR